MKRGDVVLAAARGDYGKPRPWVVVQSDVFLDGYPSITLCPITTFEGTEQDFRVRIEASRENGLRRASTIMADKAQAVDIGRVRARIGSIDRDGLRSLDTALRVWLGLA